MLKSFICFNNSTSLIVSSNFTRLKFIPTYSAHFFFCFIYLILEELSHTNIAQRVGLFSRLEIVHLILL